MAIKYTICVIMIIKLEVFLDRILCKKNEIGTT